MLYLGIDFGTSFTKAAVFDNKNNECIPVNLNDSVSSGDLVNSKYAMPTVAFVKKNPPRDNDDYVVGAEALRMRLDPSGTFYGDYKPKLDCIPGDLEYNNIYGALLTYTLRYVYDCAKEQCRERKLFQSEEREDFDKVVLTVPASTLEGSVRWKLMEHSADILGFRSKLEIITEPVAAAYCLIGRQLVNIQQEKQYVIYDFGGGTFDTAVVRVCDQQIFLVGKSVGSDNGQKWGGIYIDSDVRRDFIKRDKEAARYAVALRDKNVNKAAKLHYSDHLTQVPIKAKIKLSSSSTYKEHGYELTRDSFNQIISRMIEDTIAYTISNVQMLSKEELCKDIKDVDGIFLVGGSSHIPLVREQWEFEKKVYNASFSIKEESKSEVVAMGAAMYPMFTKSGEKLVEIGKEKVRANDFNKAALYFNNAKIAEGKFYLGMLYYEGLIGRKRKPTKALELFNEYNNPDAKLLISLMKFNGDGVSKNNQEAWDLINEIKKSDLSTPFQQLMDSLQRALDNSASQTDLDYIYSFKPMELLLNVQKSERSGALWSLAMLAFLLLLTNNSNE